MGHERIGYLPKTKKWRKIVADVGEFSSANSNVAQIASQTSKNLRNRLEKIGNDSGVLSAFKYIILLAYASGQKNSPQFLRNYEITLTKGFNLFDLTQSIQEFVVKHQDSKEYSTFAVQSIIDSVSEWSRENQIQQTLIFDGATDSFKTWQNAANGAGFCELSRKFFSKFTERYLKYFLEREASSAINNLFERHQFEKKLQDHVQEISKHAFETAKITQSFSAGWFNKVMKEGIPDDDKIQGFLSFAFKKINSEFLREENNDEH
jgi:hypothetical protein